MEYARNRAISHSARRSGLGEDLVACACWWWDPVQGPDSRGWWCWSPAQPRTRLWWWWQQLRINLRLVTTIYVLQYIFSALSYPPLSPLPAAEKNRNLPKENGNLPKNRDFRDGRPSSLRRSGLGRPRATRSCRPLQTSTKNRPCRPESPGASILTRSFYPDAAARVA